MSRERHDNVSERERIVARRGVDVFGEPSRSSNVLSDVYGEGGRARIGVFMPAG